MKRVYSFATYLLLVEGIAYSITGLILFDGRLTIDALRFMGSGLGWVFLALLNLSAVASPGSRTVTLTLVANCLAALFFLALAIVKPGAISLVALLITSVCLAGSLRALRQAANGQVQT